METITDQISICCLQYPKFKHVNFNKTNIDSHNVNQLQSSVIAQQLGNSNSALQPTGYNKSDDKQIYPNKQPPPIKIIINFDI